MFKNLLINLINQVNKLPDTHKGWLVWLVSLSVCFLFWGLVVFMLACMSGCKTTYTEPVSATHESFEKDISEYDITVVVMGASWCPACVTLDGVVVQLAKDYAGIVKFVNVDIEKVNINNLGYKDVEYIPFILIIVDGKEVFRGNLENGPQELKARIATEIATKEDK